MNLKELRQEAWDIAREVGTSDELRLWSTKEMNRYINRVYRFIAKETKCIRDDITANICRLPVNTYGDYISLSVLALTDAYAAQDLNWINDPESWFYVNPEPALTYAERWDAAAASLCPYSFVLDSRILYIDEVKWTKKQWKLIKVSASKWQTNPWWEQVRGMPTEFATDLANNRLNLNFRATDNDTLRLVVRRMPLKDLTQDTDIPELRLHYHDFMINGILYMMYSKQDAQTFDGEKKDRYYIEYLKDIDEIKQQEGVLNTRLSPNYSMGAFL